MLSFVLIAALAIPATSALDPQRGVVAQVPDAEDPAPADPASGPAPGQQGRNMPSANRGSSPEPANQASLPAPADPDAWRKGALEIGGLGGYASGTVYDPQRSSSSFVQGLFRLGVHFGPTFGGRMRGNFSIVAEGVGIAVDQQPNAAGGGVNLLIRYTWAAGRWRPSLLGGAGVLFTDEEVPPGETKHNFTPQAGVGVAYLLKPAWALSGEYRFHHLSNKGATETNPGINSHLVLFGVSWFH